MTKYLCFQFSITYGTAVTRTEVTLCWRNQCETVQLLTLTPDFIAPALCPANSPDLNPVDYEIWGKLQERVYSSRIVTLFRWSRTWLKSGNISIRCSSTKRSGSGSGVHVFKLAFEHTEDILNRLLVCLIFAQTYTLTVCLVTYSGHLRFWVTSLNRL